jgi:hypothetical protein
MARQLVLFEDEKLQARVGWPDLERGGADDAAADDGEIVERCHGRFQV